MAAKRKSSVSSLKPVQGFFKWMIKCLLTQVGCLSRQEFDDQYPLHGDSVGNLLEHLDSSDSHYKSKHRQHTKTGKRRNEDTTEDMNNNQNCEGRYKNSKDKISGGIMSFQNCTLQCADPGNGESYWVSFEEKSFSRGDEFKVYSGRMNGIGPKSGEKCVVKVFRRCQGTENMCRYEVKKCQKARVLAKAFNDLTQNIRIKFTTLYWAQMDEVSKIKQLFFTGERKLSARETVLFEDDLRVNEDKPGKHRDLTLFMDCQGEKKRCIAKDLESFAHFTYHHSNGQLVLCGFDGVQDDNGFFLKTPTIHSRKQDYGSNDRGLQGIMDVFRNHVCNEFCKDMMKPGEDFDDFTAQAVNKVSTGQCCTMFPPETQFKEEKIPQATCSHRPPFERQDSVVSSNHLPWRQGSNVSQLTESFSGYLEPTAPTEECNEVMFEPSPPPYSSVNVANWLLHEHGPNSFIPISQFEPIPPVRADSLSNRTSFESGLGASIVTPSERSSLRGTSTDLNANFQEEDVDTSGVSTSGCFDDFDDESIRTVCFHPEKKRVRFSLSGETFSSETTTTRDDLSTVANQTSQLQPASENFCNQPADCNDSKKISRCSFRLISHDSGISRTFEDINQDLAGTDCNQPFCESPPSYIDSEMATAWWVMRRECLPQKTQTNNMTHTDNGHHIQSASHRVP